MSSEQRTKVPRREDSPLAQQLAGEAYLQQFQKIGGKVSQETITSMRESFQARQGLTRRASRENR